ncbi:hypothetical protein CPB83DRAFT_908784 [Crepidotus variabilis]|uniref:F-box domain-containing protein n=1 Tax=Crepidotus variabilis TaxID=179855 RepID=A0A9P6EBG5_9AGAR|nr:hypothetical protein CPB83DRAFT_908784 [Crepidotus variabilis]
MSTRLPEDIIRIVLSYLDIKDIVAIRQSCRGFNELSKSRSVWDALYFRHVVNADIPTPGLSGRSFDCLSAEEIENFCHASLALHSNWTAPTPTARRFLRLEGISDTRVLGLHCLPRADGHRYLISLAMLLGSHRRFILRCWDLEASTPVCVAEKSFQRVSGMAVNKTASDAGSVAMLTPQGVDVLRLNPNAADPNQGFTTARLLRDPLASVAYFYDSIVAARNSDGRLFLYDVTHAPARVELLHNTEMPLDFVFTETFVLVLKTTTLELYPLPSSFAGIPRHVIIQPIFAFEFPRRVDHGVMTLRHGWPGDTETLNCAVTVFLRFASSFPWAVNLIDHFEIRPNAYYVSADSPSEMNVPYEYPPMHIQTIGSPVRMHATTHMAVGEYGTVVWIDSHTEDYYVHSHRGQRIAGLFAPLYRRRPKKLRPILDTDAEDQGYGEDEDDMDDMDDMDEEDDNEEDENEEIRPLSGTSIASTVFCHHDADNWLRLVLDEKEGVIFVGRDDGIIEIFEYAQGNFVSP